MDSAFFPLNKNERMVLALAARKEGLLQSAIPGEIEATKQTASNLAASLLKKGMLVSKESVSGGKRGQPSKLLEINPDYAYSLGVSIMSDTLAVTLMNFSGQILASDEVAMISMTQADTLAAVERCADKLKAETNIDTDRLFGVGIGITGFCLEEKNSFNPPILDDWAFVDVAEIFSNHFGLPAWVDNDGNAAAVGESMVGVGRHTDEFAYIYFSFGIGGGVISGGKLRRGIHGNAGEFAGILPHSIYPHPNLEALRQTLARHDVQIPTVRDLVHDFDPEWPGVDEWIMHIRESLCVMTSAISAVLDPSLIVLGGRMPKALAEKLIPHIEVGYEFSRRGRLMPLPTIVPSEMTGDATLVGAASIPFKEKFF